MVTVYSVSRCVYRMSKDGLLFPFFLVVDKQSDIPLRAVLFTGITSAVLGTFFDLAFLIQLTVVFNVVSYIVVASALIRLKITQTNIAECYLPPPPSSREIDKDQDNDYTYTQNIQDSPLIGALKSNSWLKKINSTNTQDQPNASSNELVRKIELEKWDQKKDILTALNKKRRLANPPSDGVHVSKSQRLIDGDNLANHSRQATGNTLRAGISLMTTINIGARCETAAGANNGVEISPPSNTQTRNSELAQSSVLPDTTTVIHPTSSKLPHTTKRTDQIDPGYDQPCEPPSRCMSTPPDRPSRVHPHLDSVASRTALWLTPIVPGILSYNVLVLLHLVACVALAVLIDYNFRDGLTNAQFGLVVVMVILVCAVLAICICLWSLCATRGDQARETFQVRFVGLSHGDHIVNHYHIKEWIS